jgi:tRNA pseudouridine32 synthase/23S rRNA pseudouridine746 synthase/23S rRNA pseudouridine1911/1915/1917 synthase
MHEKKTSFPNKSAKHQPGGLTILYEDYDIIVIDKPAGLLTMGTDREKEKTAYFMLNEYVKKGNPRSRNRIFIVHRLDRDTSGLLVFAKNEKAKHHLQDKWKEFDKRYFAVVHGILREKEGVITSYLAENNSYRVYSVTNPEKGKLAKTGHQVIKESEKYSLLEITLFTGRKNQIRVHLSEKGYPVVGDKIYGEKDKSVKRLALHSASLKILHPYSNKEMVFKTEVPPYFKTLVKIRGSSK